MGVDIFTKSGILFTLDEALDRFFKGITNSKVKKIVSEIETIVDDTSDYRKSLQSVETCSDLKVWFQEFAESGIQDDYLNNEEILSSIWYKVLENTKFADLPDVDFDYFTSNRYSGYEVPTETICVIFNDSGLFETKLTKKGLKIAKNMGLGKLKQTIWTVYSY